MISSSALRNKKNFKNKAITKVKSLQEIHKRLSTIYTMTSCSGARDQEIIYLKQEEKVRNQVEQQLGETQTKLFPTCIMIS